ncbi:MAG: hypothetical protein JXA24_06705 [Proteobacteria bacterium]|nr:hypothetical protein [Pseudomonadota bacterium]
MSDDVKIVAERPLARPREDDTRPSVIDPSLLDEGGVDAYVRAGPVETFFSGIAGLVGSLFRPKSTAAAVEPPEVINEAEALRRVMRSHKEGQRVFAARTYGALSEKFIEGSAEVYLGAAALRMLMRDAKDGVRYDAAEAYKMLSKKFVQGSAGVYREAEALRRLMTDPEGDVLNRSAGTYGKLSERFADASPETCREAAALRRLMADTEQGVRVRAILAYQMLSDRFAEGSAEVALGASELRRLMKDPEWDVRSEAAYTYGILSAKFKEDSADVHMGAFLLRRLMTDPERAVRTNAEIHGYERLCMKFAVGSPEVYEEAAALRGLMMDPQQNVRGTAADAYVRLSERFAGASPEFYREAEALRGLMRYPEQRVRSLAARVYSALLKKFAEGAPEIHEGAAAMRGLMLEWNQSEDVVADVLEAYARFAHRLEDNSPEVYKGAQTIIEILNPGYSYKIHSTRVIKSVAHIYGLLARKFRAEGPVASAADKSLRWYMGNCSDKKCFAGVFKQTFYHLSSVGFFKAGFESGSWVADLELMGFSEKAARNLRGFAAQPGFIGFRDSVMTVLDMLGDWTFEKIEVMSRVFEATDPGKWKSVRNTLRTLRALTALDSLPKEVGREFYRSHRDLEGDTRAALRSGVEKTLLAFLRERIGDDRAVDLLFRDGQPEGRESSRKWRHAQEVRGFLSDKGLLLLFAQSASFMDEEGVRILRSLISDLVMSPVLEGNLHYLKRYDRMRDQLGFSPDFVGRWRTEWKKLRHNTGESVDESEAKAIVMGQAAGQLAVHVNSTPGADGEFKELPDGLRALTEKLKSGDADMEEAKRLHDIMEKGYAQIRETYGDLFANARVDLKNLVTGLTRGVKTAKKAALTEITGLVEKIAFHGMIPTETCQRLSSLYADSTNGRGQPLNKLMWGQFKLANHIIDGEVMARRMLEVTRDEEGREHLLVERAYTAGGFARLAEFDEDIVEHAQGLGIGRARVHFLDRHEKRPKPSPLATGAVMYRDSMLPEINPAFAMPFRPLAPSVAAVPMMSAAAMLRTGT